MMKAMIDSMSLEKLHHSFLNGFARVLETCRISSNLYAVDGTLVNLYILDTGKGLVAFDTGFKAPAVKRGFEKLGLDPAKVSHVFLTHSDIDHVGSLELFSNAQIYLSESEAPLVTGKRTRAPQLQKAIKIYNRKLDDFQTLKDRQVIEAGDYKIQMISTPGHTEGSASYLINDMVLFSGDELRLNKSKQLVPFFSFHSMNHIETINSYEMLKNRGLLDKELILTGHHGVIIK